MTDSLCYTPEAKTTFIGNQPTLCKCSSLKLFATAWTVLARLLCP